MGGSWDTSNLDCEPDKSKWLAKWNPEEMPHKSNSNHYEDATQWLSLSSPVCLCIRTVLFFLFTQFRSVAESCSTLCNPMDCRHSRLPCPSPTPGAYLNSCPLSQWCHPTISSSVVPFSSRLQSFPASGSFPMSQFFTSGGQSIGVSASASVLPMNIQDWFPLGWTGLISLLSKGVSRVFSNTTGQKHQFFGAQLFYSPTLTSIHDYWKNPSFD